ncbi:hypothetical protein B0I35DRAFT_104663 [Stachybotrys elegans]|uniref:Uncharacterized protein n=1 Tax=Stachybotrys elegans TaxID=80388 RepID=A0A8K0WM26_9HYPO|nr:hypothetical protein B0I35DRAFT_104663 [Stachybotrys elegans]
MGTTYWSWSRSRPSRFSWLWEARDNATTTARRDEYDLSAPGPVPAVSLGCGKSAIIATTTARRDGYDLLVLVPSQPTSVSPSQPETPHYPERGKSTGSIAPAGRCSSMEVSDERDRHMRGADPVYFDNKVCEKRRYDVPGKEAPRSLYATLYVSLPRTVTSSKQLPGVIFRVPPMSSNTLSMPHQHDSLTATVGQRLGTQ